MKRKHAWLAPTAMLLVGVLTAVLLYAAILRLDDGRQELGRDQLELVLHRTAAACYAAEGFYPPDLSYLMKHYGITYDEAAYTVHYRCFASNLMPEITVLDKNS